MKLLPLTAASLLVASAAASEQPFEINNIYPMTQERFQLSDRQYFIQDNQGYFEVVQGPVTEGPARCIGGGFGFKDGTSTIEGICIFGEGEDTFTMAWRAGQQGAANDWEIVAATGRYKGMTGTGIATTGVEIMYRALPLRQTHIIGTVDIPAP
ncbi:hypothetical protein [Sulfitobacter aestuariivivens]|uniref:Uncharacterized protein n=1 Tax=Sulfitobacter aestuariivivens TaxID=2766981 RepID=A0A927HFV0_9RHOB|nr:hypothetical protein [Sulfitobacter aestuariivivens]MBD3664809.1 hypothetical protein [Sulfitobacter aestuariivivens]